MPGRKQTRHESENIIELDDEEPGFVLEPAEVEVGSGYSISVSYDEDGKPIIDVKTYGDVDISRLRREIKRVYPNAQIRRLSKTPSVAIARKRKGKNKVKHK
jgi:hypothetical protein